MTRGATGELLLALCNTSRAQAGPQAIGTTGNPQCPLLDVYAGYGGR